MPCAVLLSKCRTRGLPIDEASALSFERMGWVILFLSIALLVIVVTGVWYVCSSMKKIPKTLQAFTYDNISLGDDHDEDHFSRRDDNVELV